MNVSILGVKMYYFTLTISCASDMLFPGCRWNTFIIGLSRRSWVIRSELFNDPLEMPQACSVALYQRCALCRPCRFSPEALRSCCCKSIMFKSSAFLISSHCLNQIINLKSSAHQTKYSSKVSCLQRAYQIKYSSTVGCLLKMSKVPIFILFSQRIHYRIRYKLVLVIIVY